MKNTISFILILLCFTAASKPINSSLENGWKELAKNNFTAVESNFIKAAEDPEAAADAYLSLAVYHMSIHKNDEAYGDFKKFLACSKDPDPAIFASENADFMRDMKSGDKITFFEQLVQMPSVSETIKCMANERLTILYEEKGDFTKMRNAGIKIGSINDWQLLGTFENLSGSGFNDDNGAIAHPEPTYVFKDKVGADIKWFPLLKDHIRNDKWIDFEYIFYITNAIGYAQTFVTVPADEECQIRLGTSGSYKIWINDHLILSDTEERNNDLDTYISTIKLFKGTNRILIQIGASEISSLNYMCRITDSKGLPIKDAAYSSTYVPYNKTYDFTGVQIPVFSEEYYKEKIKNQPAFLLNYFLLAQSLLRNDKSYEAMHVLKDAEKLAPDCIYLLNLEAEQAARAKNTPGLSLIQKKMKEVLPDDYYVLQYDFQQMEDAENHDQAEEILNKIRTKYGETEFEIKRQIDLYASTKRTEKMLELIDQAYNRYPDYYSFVNYKFIVETQIRKNNDAGEKVMLRYINVHHNASAMDDLNDHYIKTNNTNAIVDLFEKMIKLHPYAVGYYVRFARLNYLLQNYKKAHECINICHSIAPYIGNVYESEGDLLDAEKKQSEAIKAFNTCISYSPTNYDARMKVRKLENKPDIFDSFRKFDFKEFYKLSPSADKFPEDNSLLILNATQNVVYHGGASVQKNYLMVKVFNSAGIDNWKEYSVSYYSGQRLLIDEAFVMKKNGNRVDADVNRNDIVFTNLEVNDAICISYKIENYYTGRMAQHLNDIHYFKYSIPIGTSSYELIADTAVKFGYKMSNSEMTPAVKDLGDFKMYTWTAVNIPGFSNEEDMPELPDLAPVLRISTYKTWDEVSKWYSSLSSSKTKQSFEVKTLIKELFPNNETLTEKQKAQRIYNYIVKEIRYSSVNFRQSGLIPQSNANTLNSRIGDCKDVSTLFVSMCREVGLNANLTLVCTNYNGNNFLFMPNIDFDHCIAAVTLDKQKYYIELTSEFLPFGSYSSSLINAQALEIKPNETCELFRLPPLKNANSIIRKTTITLAGEKVDVVKKTVKTGSLAADTRYTFRDKGKEQQEKTMREAISDELPSVILEKLNFDDNLNATSDTVSYEFSYSSAEALSDIGGIKALKIPFSDGIGALNILSQEKRIYPISTSSDWYTMQNEETIKLTLPPANSILTIPESKVYTSEFGDYSLTFASAGSTITINRKLKMKTVEPISPEKYPSFKSFMQKVIKSDGTQLAIK